MRWQFHLAHIWRIQDLVTLVRNFMGLILPAAIAAGGAWAQNGNPGHESPPTESFLIVQWRFEDP
jgi:hypothetical protein